jgi:hypothetical protein
MGGVRMIRRFLYSLIVLTAAVPIVRGADLNGTWNGKIQDIDLVYVLKADGNKLTGTAEGPAGKLELEDGKIDGDKITFTIRFNDRHIKHEGELVDGRIKIVTHMPGGDYEYTISKPVDFAGAWKGEAEFQNGQKIELTYNLKMDGDKLSGSVESPRGKIDMQNAKLTADGFTFVTKRNDVEVPHEVKLVDGQLAIKVRSPNGNREYKLSRVATISGPWVAMFKDDTGADLPLKFDFRLEGDKLTGTVKSDQGDGEIKNGKVTGDGISFDVEFGNTIKHKGKIANNEIKLKVDGFGTSWELNLKRPPAK